MAYQERGHPDVPAVKSTGVVVPMADGRGNQYPEFLRTQQVGLGVVRAICERIDAALAPRPTEVRAGPDRGKVALRPVKLATVHLGDGGRSQVRNYLLAKLLPELFGDPVPPTVRPVKKIVSPKAISLLNRRLKDAFDPPDGILCLPGLTLTGDDLFELLGLVHGALLADDRFAENAKSPVVTEPEPITTTSQPPPPPIPPPPPPPPVVPVALPQDFGKAYRQPSLFEL